MKFSLSHNRHDELLEKIRQNNTTLISLTDSNTQLEPSRRRHRRATQHFKDIRQHAGILHSLLKKNYHCGVPHKANLRLKAQLSYSEDVKEEPSTDSPCENTDSSLICFGVAFTVHAVDSEKIQWSWQETEIRSLYRKPQPAITEPSKSTSSLGFIKNSHALLGSYNSGSSTISKKTTQSLPKKAVTFAKTTMVDRVHSSPPKNYTQDISDLVQINNICDALQRCMKSTMYSHSCLGYLCEEGLLPLGVFLARPTRSVQGHHKPVSLAELLERSIPSPARYSSPEANHVMTRGDRLKLALTIASSVLQLYKTPWLPENWSKHDILLDESKDVLCSQVYVSDTFSKAAAIEEAAQVKKTYSHARNESLFSLGIVLIELCLEHPLESMRSLEDPLNINGEADIYTDCSTAKRLLDFVYSEYLHFRRLLAARLISLLSGPSGAVA